VIHSQNSPFTKITRRAFLAWNARICLCLHLALTPLHATKENLVPSKKKVMELSKTHLEGISKASRRLIEAWGEEVDR